MPWPQLSTLTWFHFLKDYTIQYGLFLHRNKDINLKALSSTRHTIFLSAFLEILEIDEPHPAVQRETIIRHWLVVRLSRESISVPECIACLVN